MKRVPRTRAEEAADKHVARSCTNMTTEHRCLVGIAYHNGYVDGWKAAQRAARKTRNTRSKK